VRRTGRDPDFFACAFLGQLSPLGIAHARRAIASQAIADEIHIGVVIVGWPMMLEVVEKGWPVRLEAMHLKIAERKREAVVDADQRGTIFCQPIDLPLGDASSIFSAKAAAESRPAAHHPRPNRRASP